MFLNNFMLFSIPNIWKECQVWKDAFLQLHVFDPLEMLLP